MYVCSCPIFGEQETMCFPRRGIQIAWVVNCAVPTRGTPRQCGIVHSDICTYVNTYVVVQSFTNKTLLSSVPRRGLPRPCVVIWFCLQRVDNNDCAGALRSSGICTYVVSNPWHTRGNLFSTPWNNLLELPFMFLSNAWNTTAVRER